MDEELDKARREARKRRKKVQTEYDIVETSDIQRLDLYEKALADVLRCDIILEREGYVIPARGSLMAHPLLTVKKSMLAQANNILKELAIERYRLKPRGKQEKTELGEMLD